MSDITSLHIPQLVDREFVFEPSLAIPGGRVEVWEEPQRGEEFCVGADFAYGIPGRDYDAAVVFRRGPLPIRQVAEVHGHWGEVFDKILYALCRYYNDAYLLGERQVGLASLSRLYHEYGYMHMFGDRDESSKNRRRLKTLGYHQGTGDVTLPKFRRAVRDRHVILRSRTLIEQMGKLQFRARGSMDSMEAVDADMKIKLAGGGSPDLVRAASYGWHALAEVPWAEKVVPKYAPNTLGAMLGHDVFEAEAEASE